jgi:hypothetical protein
MGPKGQGSYDEGNRILFKLTHYPAPALAAAGLAGAATLTYAAAGANALATRLVVAVALVGAVSLLLG